MGLFWGSKPLLQEIWQKIPLISSRCFDQPVQAQLHTSWKQSLQPLNCDQSMWLRALHATGADTLRPLAGRPGSRLQGQI